MGSGRRIIVMGSCRAVLLLFSLTLIPLSGSRSAGLFGYLSVGNRVTCILGVGRVGGIGEGLLFR